MGAIEEAYKQAVEKTPKPADSAIASAYNEAVAKQKPSGKQSFDAIETAYRDAMIQKQPDPTGTFNAVLPAKNFKPNTCGVYVREVLRKQHGWQGQALGALDDKNYGIKIDKPTASSLKPGMVIYLKKDPDSSKYSTNHYALVYRDKDGKLKLNELVTGQDKGVRVRTDRTVDSVSHRLARAWVPNLPEYPSRTDTEISADTSGKKLTAVANTQKPGWFENIIRQHTPINVDAVKKQSRDIEVATAPTMGAIGNWVAGVGAAGKNQFEQQFPGISKTPTGQVMAGVAGKGAEAVAGIVTSPVTVPVVAATKPIEAAKEVGKSFVEHIKVPYYAVTDPQKAKDIFLEDPVNTLLDLTLVFEVAGGGIARLGSGVGKLGSVNKGLKLTREAMELSEAGKVGEAAKLFDQASELLAKPGVAEAVQGAAEKTGAFVQGLARPSEWYSAVRSGGSSARTWARKVLDSEVPGWDAPVVREALDAADEGADLAAKVEVGPAYDRLKKNADDAVKTDEAVVDRIQRARESAPDVPDTMSLSSATQYVHESFPELGLTKAQIRERLRSHDFTYAGTGEKIVKTKKGGTYNRTFESIYRDEVDLWAAERSVNRKLIETPKPVGNLSKVKPAAAQEPIKPAIAVDAGVVKAEVVNAVKAGARSVDEIADVVRKVVPDAQASHIQGGITLAEVEKSIIRHPQTGYTIPHIKGDRPLPKGLSGRVKVNPQGSMTLEGKAGAPRKVVVTGNKPVKKQSVKQKPVTFDDVKAIETELRNIEKTHANLSKTGDYGESWEKTSKSLAKLSDNVNALAAKVESQERVLTAEAQTWEYMTDAERNAFEARYDAYWERRKRIDDVKERIDSGAAKRDFEQWETEKYNNETYMNERRKAWGDTFRNMNLGDAKPVKGLKRWDNKRGDWNKADAQGYSLEEIVNAIKPGADLTHEGSAIKAWLGDLIKGYQKSDKQYRMPSGKSRRFGDLEDATHITLEEARALNEISGKILHPTVAKRKLTPAQKSVIGKAKSEGKLVDVAKDKPVFGKKSEPVAKVQEPADLTLKTEKAKSDAPKPVNKSIFEDKHGQLNFDLNNAQENLKGAVDAAFKTAKIALAKGIETGGASVEAILGNKVVASMKESASKAGVFLTERDRSAMLAHAPHRAEGKAVAQKLIDTEAELGENVWTAAQDSAEWVLHNIDQFDPEIQVAIWKHDSFEPVMKRLGDCSMGEIVQNLDCAIAVAHDAPGWAKKTYSTLYDAIPESSPVRVKLQKALDDFAKYDSDKGDIATQIALMSPENKMESHMTYMYMRKSREEVVKYLDKSFGTRAEAKRVVPVDVSRPGGATKVVSNRQKVQDILDELDQAGVFSGDGVHINIGPFSSRKPLSDAAMQALGWVPSARLRIIVGGRKASLEIGKAYEIWKIANDPNLSSKVASELLDQQLVDSTLPGKLTPRQQAVRDKIDKFGLGSLTDEEKNVATTLNQTGYTYMNEDQRRMASRYKLLEESYVNPYTRRYLSQLVKPYQEPDLWEKAVRLWKLGKVTSPGFHIRNFAVGNPMQVYFGTGASPVESTKAIATLKSEAGKARRDSELLRTGERGAQPRVSWFGKSDQAGDVTLLATGVGSKTGALGKGAVNLGGKAFQKSEAFYKELVYNIERNRQDAMLAKRGAKFNELSAAEQDRLINQAIQSAEDCIFDYGMRPEWLDWMVKKGVAPFGTYPYKMAGLLGKTAYQNPARLAVIKNLADLTSEWIDWTYFIPFADTVESMASSDVAPGMLGKAAKGASTFVPLFQLASAALGYDSYGNKQVVDERDPEYVQSRDYIMALYKFLAPTLAPGNSAYNRVNKAIAKPDVRNVLGALGVNIKDPAEEAKWKDYDQRKQLKSLGIRGNPTPKKVIGAFKSVNSHLDYKAKKEGWSKEELQRAKEAKRGELKRLLKK
jgi:hypothetical protein